MGIGGALAEARSEAGLTVAQVSERTRIREKIICDIEHDDYTACGGDFYARGHIRAIARVVGADPVPLIKEYDAARMPLPVAFADAGPEGPVALTAAQVEQSAGAGSDHATPETPWRLARARLNAARPKQALRGAGDDWPPYTPAGITAAEAFRPGMPLDFERRRPRRTAVLVLVVFAIVAVVSYLVASASSSPRRVPTPPRSQHSASQHSASQHRAAAAARQTSSAAASPPSPARQLAIAGAAAFGPAGTGQGADPQDAGLAIDSSMATAWYTTEKPGGLQPGTGLLLKLGDGSS